MIDVARDLIANMVQNAPQFRIKVSYTTRTVNEFQSSTIILTCFETQFSLCYLIKRFAKDGL